MKMGAASVYAVLAVVYIASCEGRGPIQGKQIAEAFGIPLESLLKVLQQLVRARVLTSKRGRSGGFLLEKSPDHTSLLDILEVTEGPFHGPLSMPRPLSGAEHVFGELERVSRQIEDQTVVCLRKMTVRRLLAGDN